MRAQRAGLKLPAEAVQPLEAYFRLLARWNEKINLTALQLVPPTDDAYDRLLIEPLAAARYVPDSALCWFDIGSGGGSPAIPLKVLRPRASLTMVESKARKAAFLREVVRELDLADARVENRRFENLSPKLAETADLATMRAVRAGDGLFRSVAELLMSGGQLLWFGAEAGRIIPGPSFRQLKIGRIGKAASTLVVLERVPRGTN